MMSKVEESIAEYKASLKTDPNQDSIDISLLRAITISSGPSIYNQKGSTLNMNDIRALNDIKQSFLIETLGLKNNNKLQDGFEEVKKNVFKTNSSVPIVVFKYLLVEHFNMKATFFEHQLNNNTYNEILDFGIDFMQQQIDIDPEIRKVTDSSFQDLLL